MNSDFAQYTREILLTRDKIISLQLVSFSISSPQLPLRNVNFLTFLLPEGKYRNSSLKIPYRKDVIAYHQLEVAFLKICL